MSTGCYQPVYLDGEFVGAWGVSLHVGDYLQRAVTDVPDGATGLIVSSSGDLIAWPVGLSDPAVLVGLRLPRG